MLELYYKNDAKVEAGIDESGRGPLWGPLYAAAVIWPAEDTWTDDIRATSEAIRDSKKLTPKKRSALENQIQAYALSYGIGIVSAQEIDTLGMTRANRLAFKRALEGLSVQPQRLIIDGILTLQSGYEEIVVPQADETYLSVAAASILAKEAHDRAIRAACEANPLLQERYGLLSSKGYGTAAHRKAIQTYGMDGDHRRLFLRKLLGPDVMPVSSCQIQDD